MKKQNSTPKATGNSGKQTPKKLGNMKFIADQFPVEQPMNMIQLIDGIKEALDFNEDGKHTTANNILSELLRKADKLK